ncbi:hypothetical protein N431DRAFT_513369 [Stipitochalara longipes BDJ]|nr:hypothetical protein N431DRAFT_513369 [Stipitochalara longipes BDJ]
MSFGWSAGDIATAIVVTYELIQALDDTHGAAKDYREAVTFLTDLKRVLEPLQAFTALDAYPVYRREINQQADLIKQPITEFLAAVLKYEPSLGDIARRCWQRSIPTALRKLHWHIFMMKKVQSLKVKIESHMRILESLMQRLTLDSVLATQRSLPGMLRLTFEETIRPELIDVLRQCLHSRPTGNQCMIGDATIAKLSEHYELISSNMEEIKHQLTRPEIIQHHIQSDMQAGAVINRPKALSYLLGPTTLTNEVSTEDLNQEILQMTVTPTIVKRESLSEV